MITREDLQEQIAELFGRDPQAARIYFDAWTDEIEDQHHLTRDEWLAARQNGIGASDAAAAIGASPWKSSLGLWGEKTGRISPEEPADRDAVEMGHLLEPVVFERLRQKSGLVCSQWPQTVMIACEDRPWMRCTPDGFAFTDAGVGLVQAKTARETASWDDGIPAHYEIQVQHEMAVTGCDWCVLAVLFGGRRLEWHTIQRNQDVIDYLIEQETRFWQLVESREEPKPGEWYGDVVQRARDMVRLHPDDDGSTVMIDDPVVAQASQEYRRASEEAREIDRVKETARARLVEAIGAATFGITADGQRWSLKTQERDGYTVKPSKTRVLRAVKE